MADVISFIDKKKEADNKLPEGVEYIEVPEEYRDLRKNKRLLIKNITKDITDLIEWRGHIQKLDAKTDSGEIFLELYDHYIDDM